MIIQYPNELLKQKCAEVRNVNSEEFVSAVNSMKEQLLLSEGVGLAAPQVGVLLRIVVVRANDRIEVLVNPKIQKTSKSIVSDVEMCLSVPEKKFRAFRPKEIWYSFTDENGKNRLSKADGFKARIVMHEIDHLNGITIADVGKEVL